MRNYIRWQVDESGPVRNGVVQFFNDENVEEIENLQSWVDQVQPVDVVNPLTGDYSHTVRPAVWKKCTLKNVNVVGETYDRREAAN